MKAIPHVVLAGDLARRIFEMARRSPDTETGGLVLGRIVESSTGRTFVACEITGPGPKARLGPDSFLPDLDHYRRACEKRPELEYLGEWHKHPFGASECSLRDLEQAREIFAGENRSEILCPLCCALDKGGERFDLRCYYTNRDLPGFLPISYGVAGSQEFGDRRIAHLAVEGRLARNFLKTRRPSRTLPADVYEDSQTAHLFSKPLRANATAMLIHGKIGAEAEIPSGVDLAVVVTPCGKKDGVRAYQVEQGRLRPVETEVISLTEDVFQRNRGLLETKALRGKRVAIVGLGSIGGSAALELARAGLDRFALIDSDKISIANLCRHVCDLADLGTPKVEAVGRRISRIAPYAEIQSHAFDANSDPDRTRRICSGADAILVATDTENSRRLMNWISHELRVPVVYAGLLERAIGGRVWRVVPKVTACYECYPSQQQQAPRNEVAYSEAVSPRDLTVQPGLGNDIAFVSHLAVRFVIDTLSGQGEVPNMLFWFNHGGGKWQAEPLSLYKAQDLPINPDCPFCGNGKSDRADR